MKLSPRAIGGAFIILAITGFVGLMAIGLMNQSPVTEMSGSTRAQKPAPDFTLTLFDGGELTLSRYRGQPVVINFWASWCPPCREEAPLLERKWKEYKDQGVLFVGIDLQETHADGAAYVSEFGITYPNGLDTAGRITVDYGVIGLPVTFFITRQGVVERLWVGAIKENQLVAWIDELMIGVATSDPLEGTDSEDYDKLN